MKKVTVLLLLFFVFINLIKSQTTVNESVQFRPPSVPLITHDPCFCIWSPCDRLTDMETVHWTGARNPVHSMIKIDGKAYRLSVPEVQEPSVSVAPRSLLSSSFNKTGKLPESEIF